MKLSIKHLLFFFLTSIIIAPIQAQQNEQVVENFDDNQRGWDTGKYKKEAYKVQGGFYHIISNKPNSGFSYESKYFFIDSQKDFALETTVTELSGDKKNGAGLIWGMSDYENLYRFIVATDGTYNIGKYKRGLYYNIKRWTKSEAIKTGFNVVNLLKIVKDNQGLRFYINGKLIYRLAMIKFRGMPFFGNKVGFMAGNVRKVKFDYLKITRVKRPINLVANANKTYEKENLGPNVNENSREITPIISADGNTLYFIRNYHPKNTQIDNEDVWLSTLDKQGNWTKAENIGRPINNKDNNGVLSVSPDGNTLLVGHTYKADGTYGGSGLSITHRTKTGWSLPKAMKITDYYNDYNQYWASLSLDRQKLFMAVQRRDSYGESDLYISFLQPNGTWSKPKNLGKTLNTGARESSPFLSADNQTLYFSSSGHPGYGKADVFMSRRLDDTWTKWSKPQNLGPAINTKNNDEDFILTAKGDYAYLSTYVNKTKRADIFRIKLTSEAKPKPVVMVYGKVLNKKTGQPLSAKISYSDLNSGKLAGIARSNPKDGSYKIILPYNKAYDFLATRQGYYSVSNHLDLKSASSFKAIKRNLYLAPIRVGAKIRLNNLFFDTGKSDLKRTSYGELNRLIRSLKRYPKMTIEIGGHTDSQGNAAKNKTLSNARAKAVRSYLRSKGIATSRMKAKGYGQTKPVASNNTAKGRALNRRVEFTILTK